MKIGSSIRKKIGLFSMILFCLNAIIGSGLFLLPGAVASIAGKWALLAYFAIALIVMAIAWCFAKCASGFSRNGGVYLYAKEAFGNFIGFEIGIIHFVVCIIAWASLAVGFASALGAFFPVLLLNPFKQIFLISLIGALGVLNLLGVKAVEKLNNVITLAKLLPLIVLVFFGLFAMHPAFLFSPEMLPFQISSFGSAALMIFYAFSGFESLPVAAGEMKDPKKNVPLAISIAIFSCSIFYFLIQTICIGVLGPQLSASLLPLADVAGVLFGTTGKLLASIAMLVSMGGITVMASFFTPLSISALAKDRMVPSKLMQENRFGSPYLAILISVVLTCFVALSGSFVQLITISVISRFAQHIVTCLALFAFERKGIMQPFDKPWKRLIPIFALMGMGFLMVQAEFYQLLWGFSALVLGVPLYFLQRKWSSKLSQKELDLPVIDSN